MKNEVGVVIFQIPPDKIIVTSNLIPPNQILQEFLVRLSMPPFQQPIAEKIRIIDLSHKFRKMYVGR
jgi:hypothetical protein